MLTKSWSQASWHTIKSLHSQIAAFRAIENGVSMVRPARWGLSTAVDAYGRTLATMDYFKTKDKVFTAYVPEKGIWTVYSQIGDVFAWLSVVGIVTLMGLTTIKSHAFRGSIKS